MVNIINENEVLVTNLIEPTICLTADLILETAKKLKNP